MILIYKIYIFVNKVFSELRLLLPNIFGGSAFQDQILLEGKLFWLYLILILGNYTKFALIIPTQMDQIKLLPSCSPIVVLLGQDENNQSAVVVLGDEDQDDKDGDVSAVIGKIRLIFF